LALIYSSALAAWAYAALASFAQIKKWSSSAGAIGAALIWFLVFIHYTLHDTPTDAGKALSDQVHKLIQTGLPEFDEIVPRDGSSASSGTVVNGGMLAG